MTFMTKHRALALATLLAATSGFAQQANPLDAIPDKLPFDIPYGAPISLDRADAALAAALAEAKAKGWPMICAIVDSGANLVSFKRMDGAQTASITISQHKARTSVRFRRETKVLVGAVQGGFNYLLGFIQDDIVTSTMGMPPREVTAAFPSSRAAS